MRFAVPFCLALVLIHPIVAGSANAEVAGAEPAPKQNPFAAYPWFPLPDPGTREQPDATLAGPTDSTPPPHVTFSPTSITTRLGGSLAPPGMIRCWR